MRKQVSLSVVLLLLVFSAVPKNSIAQQSKFTPARQTVFQYAAKFVCGRGDGIGALSGDYLSFVNVHNPSPDKQVRFKKQFAIARYGEQAGPVTRLFDTKLEGGETMGVECRDVYNHTGVVAGTLLEGFAVFQSPVELDVVTVYSAGSNTVQSFHTERVPARQVSVPGEIRIETGTIGQVLGQVLNALTCTDLNYSLNTGGASYGPATWMVTADPSGASVPHPSFTRPSFASWGNVPGAGWTLPASGGANSDGKVTYSECFCLCDSFSDARIGITGLLADNQASVFLNGTLLFSTPNNYFTGVPLTYTSSDPSLFRAGQNCVTVEVTNSPSSMGSSMTGFSLAGAVTARGGRCP